MCHLYWMQSFMLNVLKNVLISRFKTFDWQQNDQNFHEITKLIVNPYKKKCDQLSFIHWKPGFIHIVNSNTFRHPICWSSCKSECVNVVCVNRWQFLFTDQFHFISTRFAHRRNADEFIKERERYATIGDDLDFAFVGQILNCFHWVFDFVYRSQFEMKKMFQLIL